MNSARSLPIRSTPTYEYCLMVASSGEELSTKINKYLLSGWKLYEGPCITKTDLGALVSQALIREVERR